MKHRLSGLGFATFCLVTLTGAGLEDLDGNSLSIDLNSDGVVDFRREFDARGALISWTRDANHDGRMDVKMSRNEDGEEILETDTDYDGRFETKAVRRFKDSRLLHETIESDRNGDGKRDVLQERAVDHASRRVLIWTETDDDFDGKFDPGKASVEAFSTGR